MQGSKLRIVRLFANKVRSKILDLWLSNQKMLHWYSSHAHVITSKDEGIAQQCSTVMSIRVLMQYKKADIVKRRDKHGAVIINTYFLFNSQCWDKRMEHLLISVKVYSVKYLFLVAHTRSLTHSQFHLDIYVWSPEHFPLHIINFTW